MGSEERRGFRKAVHDWWNAIHVELRTIAFLAVFLTLAHCALVYYFDLDILAISASFAGLLAVISAIAAFISETAKEALKAFLTAFLRSRSVLWTLIVCSVLILGADLVFQRVVLMWKGPQINVGVDGVIAFVGDTVVENNEQQHSIFGFFMPLHRVSVGPIYLNEIRYRPFLVRRVRLPSDAVFSATQEYRILAGLIALAYFQTTPNKYLAEAERNLNLKEKTDEKADLPLLLDISRRCVVADEENALGRQIQIYVGDRYRQSAWNTLLKACELHKRHEFADTIALLNEIPIHAVAPVKQTIIIFRAINEMELYKQRLRQGTDDAALFKQLQSDFALAIMAAEEKGYGDSFPSIAVDVAHLFGGFAYVYGRKLDDAEKEIDLATTSSDQIVRSRAFNALGYIEDVRGNTNAAIQWFGKALEINPDNASAMINVAFGYLEQGERGRAVDIFSSLIKKPVYREQNESVVVLAQIGQAYAEMEANDGDGKPFFALMNGLKRYDFANVSPESLRLAHIFNALGDWFANDEKYQGQEYFATALYANACLQARRAAADGAGREAQELSASALAAFKRIRASVLQVPHDKPIKYGLFKAVTDLINSDQGALTAQPAKTP